MQSRPCVINRNIHFDQPCLRQWTLAIADGCNPPPWPTPGRHAAVMTEYPWISNSASYQTTRASAPPP